MYEEVETQRILLTSVLDEGSKLQHATASLHETHSPIYPLKSRDDLQSRSGGCGQEVPPPPSNQTPNLDRESRSNICRVADYSDHNISWFSSARPGKYHKRRCTVKQTTVKTQAIRRPAKPPVITIFLFNSTLRTMNDVWKWKVISKQAMAVSINHWWNRVVGRAWMLFQRCINFHKTII